MKEDKKQFPAWIQAGRKENSIIMKLYNKPYCMTGAVGFHVTLREVPGNRYYSEEESINKFTKRITLCIPKNRKNIDIPYLGTMIDILQDGFCWDIRAEWDNLTQFLTAAQLKEFDREISPALLYIYGTPADYILLIKKRLHRAGRYVEGLRSCLYVVI